MDQENLDLNRISTLWTVIGQAHEGPTSEANAARQLLLERYRKAVHRYLQGALRDPHAADEVAQEFALRLIRGDCRGADPSRGRFRDFVKGILFHLIADYHRRRQRDRCEPLPGKEKEPAAQPPELADSDRQFLETWRNELLAHSWKELAHVQQQTGQPFHAVLRFRVEHPDLNSTQMAERLTESLGKPVSAASVRQTLHRARAKLIHLLLQEVAHTLENPTVDQLEQELLDLGLLDYCRAALDRLRGRA
jgi:RNA polymerase sigma factor (sigma-70 family)